MKPVLLNFSEIKRKYHDQWVLIVDPIYDRTNRIKRGRVLFHSEDREKIDKVMLETKSNSIAIRYLGTLDKDLSIILKN